MKKKYPQQTLPIFRLMVVTYTIATMLSLWAFGFVGKALQIYALSTPIFLGMFYSISAYFAKRYSTTLEGTSLSACNPLGIRKNVDLTQIQSAEKSRYPFTRFLLLKTSDLGPVHLSLCHIRQREMEIEILGRIEGNHPLRKFFEQNRIAGMQTEG